MAVIFFIFFAFMSLLIEPFHDRSICLMSNTTKRDVKLIMLPPNSVFNRKIRGSILFRKFGFRYLHADIWVRLRLAYEGFPAGYALCTLKVLLILSNRPFSVHIIFKNWECACIDISACRVKGVFAVNSTESFRWFMKTDPANVVPEGNQFIVDQHRPLLTSTAWFRSHSTGYT